MYHLKTGQKFIRDVSVTPGLLSTDFGAEIKLLIPEKQCNCLRFLSRKVSIFHNRLLWWFSNCFKWTDRLIKLKQMKFGKEVKCLDKQICLYYILWEPCVIWALRSTTTKHLIAVYSCRLSKKFIPSLPRIFN